MRNIQTKADFDSLVNETYIYAAVVAVVIFLLALLVANLISYQGGKDRSYIKRRVWTVAFIVLGSLGFWLYNNLHVMGYIRKAAFQNQFASCNNLCLLITAFGSLVLCVVWALLFRHSKFGSMLGKKE